ncbi:MAG: glycine--tRNA ligase subunit beta, partial [Gammaproteobacteria bacterium]|nr:glycine--tRNA ligase subunit beta [Gammaproteobacteria bacterium]
EFPALQGTMGKYYALQSNETAEVARAIEEQYMPRQAGASLPETETGRIIAIADKLDTLIGIFAIGQTPTGEKDPYGLRRSALGCLRIMIECQLDLDLKTCLIFSAGTFDKKIKADTVTDSVFDFMMERLQKYYSDSGVTVDIFESVLQCRPTRPYDFHQRVKAVSDFTDLPEAESLAAANKRIHNILRQAGCEITPAIDGSLSVEDAEKDLVKKLNDVTRKVEPLTRGGNYTEALKELSGLRDSIDNFFDNVMVMVEDDNLRIARLQLLATIRHEFTQIADISRLQ